jgi:hypothetical protein
MNNYARKFGGGAADTTVLPFTLLILAIAFVFILLLPRKYVVIPLLVASILIPGGQVIVLGPFHFMVFRILTIFGWVRLFQSGALSNHRAWGFRFNSLDKAIILWAAAAALSFVLLYGEMQAFVNRLGFLFDAFGMYFLFRFLIRDFKDMDRIIKSLAILCSIIAVFMVIEQVTGRNFFSIFGGVSEFTAIRDGKLRSQGPFAHPIVSGTFGAVWVPLFVGLWQKGRRARLIAAVGLTAAAVMVLTSASSTPLLACTAGIVGLCFWPFRKQMRWIRWAVVTLLVSLHLVMKAPVWALIARVDVIGASSGYHRYELVNQTIRHFGDWWLYGVKDTSGWGWNMGDTANQFVDVAVTGGLVTLMLFIGILAYSFQRIGLARKACKNDLRNQRFVWALGACLFANVVAFFGITYFDQTQVTWFALLAMIAAVPVAMPVRKTAALERNTPAILDSAVLDSAGTAAGSAFPRIHWEEQRIL